MKEIEIIKLGQDQVELFQELVRLFNKVFEWTEVQVASVDYCKKTLSSDNFIALAASKGDQLVGGITAHILPSYYSGKEEMFIYDLAVLESFQRKGIGTMLMNSLFEEARLRDLKVVFLDAENEDEEAINFYIKLGGERMNTSQFTYHL